MVYMMTNDEDCLRWLISNRPELFAAELARPAEFIVVNCPADHPIGACYPVLSDLDDDQWHRPTIAGESQRDRWARHKREKQERKRLIDTLRDYYAAPHRRLALEESARIERLEALGA